MLLGVAFARDSLLRVVLAAVEDEENERRRRGEGEAALAFAIWRSPSPPTRPQSETVDGFGLVVEIVEFQFKTVRAQLYKLVGAWFK